VYDAVLLVSFGGPEGPDDVIPFLENVTRGRGIPRERLAEVGEHYLHFGGVSPINEQNRLLLAAIRADFAAAGIELPVYWGNRNWDPYLADALREMADDGVRRALAFVTAAYSSYSSCRQYRENLATAQAEVGSRAPDIDKIRHYFNHPGFVEPMIDNTVAALASLPTEVAADARLAFTTHSIPLAQAETSGPQGGAYVRQHLETARLVAEGTSQRLRRGIDWDLVYQSRSGPPSQAWLEPDIGDHLRAERERGTSAVVMVPIGFVSDHIEVAWDLDTEAVDVAAQIGLPVARAGTVGTDPRFVAMVRELVCERLEDRPTAERPALGTCGPSWDACPVGCCPNLRGPRPSVAQQSVAQQIE
jgi:protoporphyrin/coproporphyrin ferrochelatase